MTAITTEQNSDRQLQRLAAQRHLYSRAKTILAWQVFLSGPVAVASAFAALTFPPIKGYVALWGVALVMADLIWLTPWQKRLKDVAARIQEAFDCDVLALPWNDIKAGKRPDPELVRRHSQAYSTGAGEKIPLTDWYPKEAAGLPVQIGRLICQRSNCWWDSEQRKRYATWTIGAVAVIFIVVLVFATYWGLTLEAFLLSVFVPLAPALVLGIRHFMENKEAAARQERLKEHTETLWDEALGGATAEYLTNAARNIQDEILDGRKRNPLVFDAVFRLLRDSHESQMNHAASDLTRQAKERIGLAASNP